MEENLMERLLTDFEGVLEEFNGLVRNNDVESVRKVLDEVARLLQERDEIVLDDRPDPQYDHVLHELLDRMTGIMELENTVQGINGVPGTRYYTNQEVQDMIADYEAQMENAENSNMTEEERNDLLQRIEELRGSIVEGATFSTLTYVDPHLAELQEERARLIQEKMNNLREIARLSGEEVSAEDGTPVDPARLEEINSRISELENLIPNLQNQINDARAVNISDLIQNLRQPNERMTELEARRASLQEELRRAGDRVRETRGFDEQNAQAQADFNNITRQISDIENEIGSITQQNNSDIEFLESLLPETQERENVLDPEDYTYMGRLSDEQIIRRLLSERLNLSEEEINNTIGEYSLEMADDGAYDDGYDNPVANRQLVRTRTVRGDITVGEAIDALEAQLYVGPVIDHTQEIADIDSRISELDEVIRNAETNIQRIQGMQLSEVIAQRQENGERAELEARRASLQEELRRAGDRVRETRGFDEQNAQARADYSDIVRQISDIEAQIQATNRTPEENEDIEFLESLLPKTQERENVLDPEDYTYMGRLSDEQIIRRLLSERLNLSEEEINNTIGEYSLEMADDGAYDDGYDNPVANRQLVRTRTVRGDISVSEVSQDFDRQIAELQNRLQQLQEELRKAGERVRETRGFDEQNAQARADYSDIVRQISELEAQIAALQERQDRFNKAVGIKQEQDKIADAKQEQETLRNRRQELENDTREENPEIREKLDRLKQIAGISELEKQLKDAQEEIARLKQERDSMHTSQGRDGVDNSARIAELKNRNNDIINRIGDIDREIKGIPGAVPTKNEKNTLDVSEEAHRIGDNIFKTAKIRRELANREISREEFLEFYQAGLLKTREQMDLLSTEKRKFEEEMYAVVTENEDEETIDKRLKKAIQEQNKEEIVKLTEALRKNFITVGREEQLQAVGIDHEITSEEDVKAMLGFFEAYKASMHKGWENLRTSIAELKENADIFATEVVRLQNEIETIRKAGETEQEIETKSDERKQLRRQLLEISITPMDQLSEEQLELLEKWQTASERFLSKKTTKEFTYTDSEGNKKTIDVDTIGKYEGYEQDVDLLGVPAYRENLEQISAYEQTHDPYVFGEEVGRAYDEAESRQEGLGEEVLQKIMYDKQRYVDTFNGIPNSHRIKYENLKTAGSTLKGMKPVNRDLPIGTRAANVVENVGRFFGIRVPKFTRLDEHGNKVSNIAGGLTTLGLDALVVGAVAIAPAIAATAYAAKGIVTAGNLIAARREYSKYKDEIDNNKPELNQASKSAREVARKEYYREQGDNRFVSWVKAKSDKYFTKGREKETERAIIEKLASRFEENEENVKEGLKKNLGIAKENQKARLDRQRQVAMSANTYNDIVRNPDAVDMDEATAAIARNAALEASKPGRGTEDVNKSSNEQRKHQYVKQEGPVAQTTDLDEEALRKSKVTVGPISAITLEQAFTGKKLDIDRLNKVLTIITTGALRFGYVAIRDGFIKTETVHHDAVYENQEVEVPTTTTRTRTEMVPTEVKDYKTVYDTDVTLKDVVKNAADKTTPDHGVMGHYSVSGGERGGKLRDIVESDKITAGWLDDGSKWGTGISDKSGLTAPVLTERTADVSLLQSNGVLNNDATVAQLLENLQQNGVNLETLEGVYVSVSDKYWVKLSDLMQGLTRQVENGSHTEMVAKTVEELVTTTTKKVVPKLVTAAYDETIKTTDWGVALNAIRDGLIGGAVLGVVGDGHEAANQTFIWDATPGISPDETIPHATDSFEDIIEIIKADMEKYPEHDQDQEQEQDGEEKVSLKDRINSAKDRIKSKFTREHSDEEYYDEENQEENPESENNSQNNNSNDSRDDDER